MEHVEHEGNQNRSNEEVEAVRSIYSQLFDGSHQWAKLEGNETVLLSLTHDDVLIVVPYNAQVSALRSQLPDAAHIGTVDKDKTDRNLAGGGEIATMGISQLSSI